MTTLTAANPTLGGAPMAVGPAPTFAAPPGAGITPADFFRVLRQRMLMIILLGLLLSSMAVGGVLIWYKKYPGFSADSLIQVTSLKPRDLAQQYGDERIDYKQIEREIQDQVYMLTSPAVLDRALKDPELRRSTWYLEARDEAQRKNESELDLLQDILSVAPIRESNLIRVSAVWRIADEVPKIVNTVVNEYLKEINKRTRDDLQIQQDELRVELDRAQKLFNDKKEEIKTFLQSAGISGLGGDIDMEVNRFISQKVDLELMISQLRAIKDEMESKQPKDIPIDEEMQQLLAQDPVIFRLEAAARDAERILDLQKSRFLANHSSVKTAQAAYDTANERLSVARAQKIIQYQQRRIEEAVRNYERLNASLIEVKEKLSGAQARQRDKDNKLAKYEALLEERDLMREQYERLENKRIELARILQLQKTVRIERVSTAVPPKRISSPQLKLFLPLSVFVGFGLSAGLAVLLDLSDKSVRTPRDVTRSQLSVLGTIPTTDDDEVDIERVETACLDAPHSVVAEAFRSLRANLFFSAPAEQQGVILVTSPSGGNGKTTVATNLAISIALSGRRVLLIDANLRRPSLPTLFPSMRVEGLSNMLIGQGQLRDYVCESPVPGLELLGAGPMPPNPAELLGSSYLRDIIVDARSRYDQVIFDGPPVLLVSDAMVLAGAVDGCLLVCQYRHTSRGALQRSRFNLDAINARIFGAVLNEVESRRGGYFRKSYRDYYEYQEQDEDGGERPTLDVSGAYQSSPASTYGHDEHGRGGGGAISLIETSSQPLDETMADFEDDPAEPTDFAGPETTVATAPPVVEAPSDEIDEEISLTPKTPEVDTGPGLDLGSLPDLSDLDSLDVRVDVDLEAPPPTPPVARSDSATRDDDDALDLDALADEMEELESDDFRIDDRFDLGDDVSDDDSSDDRR